MNTSKFKLINGNCIEVLERAASNCVDLVITDLPYLFNYIDKVGRSIVENNDGAWLVPAFEQIVRVMKPDRFCVSFYDWNHVDTFMTAWRAAGLCPVGHLIWAKAYSSNRCEFLRSTHEGAYLLTNGRPDCPALRINDVLPWSYSGNELHPTQKPVSALEPLVAAFSKPGETVLDPFAGSGSTGQAALLQNRDFLGIELAPEYAEVARERLARFGQDMSAC